MYFQHWKLKRPPFDPQPDSTFLFPTPENQLALTTMTYAACEGGEPVVVEGPCGCGKTLLLRALRRNLPRERYRPLFLPEIGCGRVGLLRRISWRLAQVMSPTTEAAMERIVHTVEEYERREHTLLLMIDDWPTRLTDRTLSELRWLLNLDILRARMCLFFAGDRLGGVDEWPTWLAQRVCARVGVQPLDQESTAAYLQHRMRIAGGSDTAAFTPEAAQMIHAWSNGVPRLINRVAHMALHIGYEDLAVRVDAAAVDTALRRLARPPQAAKPAPHLAA